MYQCINTTLTTGQSYPPSFLDPYIMFTWFLRYKVLCIVMSFLVLWSICWCSLVNIKNGPEYLTRGKTQVFISFIRFLLCILVSRSLLVLLRYSFSFFIHIRSFDSIHFQYSQEYVSTISPSFLIFLELVLLFPVICCFLFFIISDMVIAQLSGIYLSGFSPYLSFFLLSVWSTHQFCMVFSVNFMTSPDILYILRESNIQFCGTTSSLFVVKPRHSLIFSSRLAILEDV